MVTSYASRVCNMSLIMLTKVSVKDRAHLSRRIQVMMMALALLMKLELVNPTTLLSMVSGKKAYGNKRPARFYSRHTSMSRLDPIFTEFFTIIFTGGRNLPVRQVIINI